MREKRIRKWKTAASGRLGTVYLLREMAEQGMILEDMNHLMYIFREGESQYLHYRIETREEVLTEEKRMVYAAEGWQEVCHYELEYVFVKERDPFAEEPEVDRQELIEEIDVQIEQEKKNDRLSRRMVLGVVFFGWLIALLILGTPVLAGEMALRFLLQLAPSLLLAFLGGFWSIRRLQQKKERIQEGDIPEEYTDWRAARKQGFFSLLWGLVILGLYFYCNVKLR
ncbi:DUF2812 domain-containing protein [Anaerotignum sp.]